MGSKLNHHFVPQYLFRLFSGGERYIHLVTKPTLRIILGASIKGQCARPKFYRTEELEDELAKLDACHAAAYRAVCREAWSSSRIGLNEADIAGLYGGLMLQRARTPRTATQMADGSDRLILYAFREYVKSLPDDGTRDQILEALDKNQITLVDSEKRALMHSLRIALQDVIGITDLDFAVLRNHTDLPFIFADSPCVFYNRYLYDFESVGVLGFQSPGLMILMPIDPFTQVLLYDGNVYETYNSRTFVDLIGDSDISQLNALQVHSAKSALYFSFAPHADYVTDLIRAHRPSYKESNSEFLVHAPGTHCSILCMKADVPELNR